MSDFIIRCTNGHKIQVKDEYRGRRLACPKCRSHVRVPEQDDEEGLDDFGLLEILGDVPPLPPQPGKSAKLEDRKCEQCGRIISHHVTICQHCHTFLGVSGDLLGGE